MKCGNVQNEQFIKFNWLVYNSMRIIVLNTVKLHYDGLLMTGLKVCVNQVSITTASIITKFTVSQTISLCLTVIFQMNLGQPVPHQFSSSTCSRTEPLGINDTQLMVLTSHHLHTSSVPTALNSSVTLHVPIHLWTTVALHQGTGTANWAYRITPGSRLLNPI